MNAYHQLHQKPNEALQTYNTRYALFFNLAYPELELENPLSRMHCIHYASSLYGKLRDEMTGRFNQGLPEYLQRAFEKAMNFEPRIITKQSINNRKIHKVYHINITHGEDEVEINKAHVRNPNYKGKNYDPNYQQNRSKMTNTTNNASSHHNNTNESYGSSSHHNNSNPGYGYNKSNQQEKPVNVSVTLHGPFSKEQLYKIQEVLQHPSQYRDRIKPEDHPVKGKYANAFNKFHPKKVEVNEATVEDAIKCGHLLKRSKEDITEAINIYVMPPQSWGDRSDTKHSKCLLLGGRRLNQLTLIPKPKGSGGARAAMAQVGPANKRNDTKRCLDLGKPSPGKPQSAQQSQTQVFSPAARP